MNVNETNDLLLIFMKRIFIPIDNIANLLKSPSMLKK